MSEVKYTFTVDGDIWSKNHLERLEYERNLHILHYLNRLGVDIEDGDKVLTDSEIDYLTEEKAWEISIETRMRYRGEDAIALFREDYKLSDAMWKELGFAQDKAMKVSHCDISVTGVSLQEYMAAIRTMQTEDRAVLAAHPEHFNCHVSFDNGEVLAIEPFGMYGTPTLVNVKMVELSQLGAQIQADKLPDYPLGMPGAAFLADGVTAVNCPFHQFKPTEDGFECRAAVYWAENAPDEIVNGHSLHLAMEFYEGLKLTGKVK